MQVELNDQQRRAVEADDGPLMIIAGPGTGKTKTLTARIAFLVQRGVRPEHILALTFTKKAAEEMQSRVTSSLNGKTAPRIATFHALCHELLGGDAEFIAEAERLQIIRELSKPAALKTLSVRELSLLISRAKNKAVDDAVITKLVAAYDARLAELSQLDFDDLLVKTYQRLQSDEAVRRDVQQRFTHVLVDEFQDTNRLQYELLHLLCGHDNIFVIGDPNQSIYGFRGASGDIFAQFAADFPRVTKITLQINYRSVPEVVAVTNAVFSDQLQAATQIHGTVRAVQVLNEYSEANWVIGEIQKAIGGSDLLKAVSDDDRVMHKTLRDFAVLYRNRSAAVALRRVLDDSGLPYQVAGDGSPYEQPNIQKIIALLREQPADASPYEVVKTCITELGLEPSHDIQQFLATLVRFATITEALAYIDELVEQQFYDPRADAISLLTIHAAKGLEFAHVFVVGAEAGLLPYGRADKQEEKRLFYVAVSRAKQSLDLLYATRRGGKDIAVSPFIQQITDKVLPHAVDPSLQADRKKAQKNQLKRRQTTLF